MTKGITYFCTDSDGNSYTRFSAGHTAPIYTTARIFRIVGKPAAHKSSVTYSSQPRRCIQIETVLTTYEDRVPTQHAAWDEVVPVRAYPGRHKVEPVAVVASPAREVTVATARDVEANIEAIFGPAPESAPQTPLEPTKALYGELQVAYDYFNAELFKGRLPHCLMTLKCKPNSRGHYAHARFVAIGGGDQTDEIAMNPISLGVRPLKDSLSTLVHEMVHLEQQHFGTPGKGAHHNKEWGVWMKRQGLHPSATSAPGGKETGNKMSHYIVAGGPFDCAADALIATGYKLSWADGGRYDQKAGSKQGKRIKYECVECGQACWAKHDAKFICGECEIPLVEVG